ncbi:MAG TPA: TlpA disulfide reductase family protein [Casimicrobiaceae bacterium]
MNPGSAIRLVAAVVAAAWTAGALAVGVGDNAPAFSLAGAQGETVSLERLRGQVVYVDFWASWCGPCKRSFPWMNELVAKYGKDGFTVVAVNVDKKAEDAQRFLAATPARFTVVYDAAATTPAAYQVKGMPSSFLVDRSGRVVMVEQGFRDEQKATVESRIRELLAAR